MKNKSILLVFPSILLLSACGKAIQQINQDRPQREIAIETVAPPTDISQGTNSSMANYSISTNKQGDVLVIWMESGGASRYHYNYYSGNTHTWFGAKQLITDATKVYATGTSDRFIVAWVQLDSLYASEFMDGGFRGTVKNLDARINSTSSLSINFIESQDNILVTWEKKDASGNTNKYASVHMRANANNPNNWSVPVVVNTLAAGENGFASADLLMVGTNNYLRTLRFSNSTATWSEPVDLGLSNFGRNLRMNFHNGTYFATWTEEIPLSTAHSAHSNTDGTWTDDGLLGPTGYTVGYAPAVGTSPLGLAVVWLSNDYGLLYSNVFQNGAWLGYETLSTKDITPPSIYSNSNSLLAIWGHGNPAQLKQFIYFADQAKWRWTDSFDINDLEDQHYPTKTIVNSTTIDYYIINPSLKKVVTNQIHNGVATSITLDDGVSTQPTAINAIANGEKYAVVWRRTNSSGLNEIVASTYAKNSWLAQPNILGEADSTTDSVRLVNSGQKFCATWLITRQDDSTLKHIRSVCGF